MKTSFIFTASELPEEIYNSLEWAFQRNTITHYYIGQFVEEYEESEEYEKKSYCLESLENCKKADNYFKSILSEKDLEKCENKIFLEY